MKDDMGITQNILTRLLLVLLFLAPMVLAGLVAVVTYSLICPYFIFWFFSPLLCFVVFGTHFMLLCLGVAFWKRMWGKWLAIVCIALQWIGTGVNALHW
jgi:hypothetical protein